MLIFPNEITTFHPTELPPDNWRMVFPSSAIFSAAVVPPKSHPNMGSSLLDSIHFGIFSGCLKYVEILYIIMGESEKPPFPADDFTTIHPMWSQSLRPRIYSSFLGQFSHPWDPRSPFLTVSSREVYPVVNVYSLLFKMARINT